MRKTTRLKSAQNIIKMKSNYFNNKKLQRLG